MTTPLRFGRWVVLCATAKFLGIAAAALWYGAVNALFGEPTSMPARVAVWLLMSLAGVAEGGILGAIQAFGIRSFLPAISPRRWLSATIAIALIGWGIGTFIPMFIDASDAGQGASEPGIAATIAFAAAFGIAVGAVFGLAQTWALPPKTRRKGYWIVANMAGWAVALPLIYAAAQIAADLSDWLPRVLLWAIGGLAAGAVVGTATGVALVSMSGHHRDLFSRPRSGRDRSI